MQENKGSKDGSNLHVSRRHMLATGGAALTIGPFYQALAQTNQFPGVYIQELDQLPKSISAVEMSVGLFIDRFSNDLAENEAHECFNEADLYRLVGKEGALFFPVAYASAKNFFVHGGQRLFIVNASTIGEKPDWASIFDEPSILPDAELVYLPTAAQSYSAALNEVGALYRKVLSWCESQRAMLLIDGPETYSSAAAWRMETNINSAHAVVYAPGLKELNCERMVIGAGGAAAGVIATFERRRGVWKAPAGLNATLVGLLPATEMSGSGVISLTNQNINAIRSLPGGTVLWGARTLSNDPFQKYLSVQRLVMMIEKSIYAGLDWAVFEPNAEPLWSSIEASVFRFLTGLYRQGAFSGTRPDKSFFVECGLGQTMTQADIDSGRLVCMIGIAPLRPAEFIVRKFEWEGLPV